MARRFTDIGSLTGQQPPTAAGRMAFWGLIAAAVLTVVLWQIPGGNYILYPFTILATWFHEMAHGLTALLLGGRFTKLLIFSDGSGAAYYSGPLLLGTFGQVLVAAAGPMGPPVAGAALILTSRSLKAAQTHFEAPGKLPAHFNCGLGAIPLRSCYDSSNGRGGAGSCFQGLRTSAEAVGPVSWSASLRQYIPSNRLPVQLLCRSSGDLRYGSDPASTAVAVLVLGRIDCGVITSHSCNEPSECISILIERLNRYTEQDPNYDGHKINSDRQPFLEDVKAWSFFELLGRTPCQGYGRSRHFNRLQNPRTSGEFEGRS